MDALKVTGKPSNDDESVVGAEGRELEPREQEQEQEQEQALCVQRVTY